MTNQQLCLAIGIPCVINAALIGLLITYVNAPFAGLGHQLHAIDHRFDAIDQRFDAINERFNDMRELWRAELRRVEEVLDARLKHIEESR